jgi:type IV pilus assembly protein PilQ
MKYEIPKWIRLGAVGLFPVMIMAGFTGCVSDKAAKQPVEVTETTAPSGPKRIISVDTKEDSESITVMIQGSSLLTYTSVKRLFPLGVVLYFPETTLGNVQSPLTLESDLIAAVTSTELTEKGHTTRVEVGLKRDIPYEVVREGAGLKIAFKKPSTAPGEQPVEPERRPAPEDKTPGDKAEPPPVKAETAPAGPAEKPEKIAATKAPAKASPEEYKEAYKKTAWVERIDFLSEDEGKSTVIIGTTTQVAYEIKKAADNRVQLKLFNTRLHDFRQRPLITTRFESAVDRVIPEQAADAKNVSIFTMELREPVPYFVEQTDNMILVHFEASSIPPKPFEEAKLPSWKKVFAESAAAPGEKRRMETAAAAAIPAGEPAEDKEAPAPPGPMYTGEKIALDFFDTDIKNVFRILMEVSGKNFAIDKDVTGKVTLTLDKPVPWDQVLALILKMNKLGQIPEGDIIRIATQTAIKAEKKLAQETVEAEYKAKEKKVAFEPLVTEYIPINYANASSDIQPHLQKILTPERGKVSVDQRTNLIIMTDTKGQIKLAKELVRRLDKVTPQVLIEARIVEATSQFTRNLGVEWSVDGTADTGDPNKTFGYDMAVNLAQAGLGTLGFNFSRLVGSTLLIDAQLQAAESRGETKIISSPKILTLDSKEATIKQGEEYPYQTVSEGEVQIEFKAIDLTLSVTPQITSDDRISMKIDIEKNDVGILTADGPTLTTKSANTELLINDGETVVIGGIIKKNTQVTSPGIVGLRDIPVIGWLFKSEAFSENKEELLIFITPQIVRLQQRNTASELSAQTS